MLQNILDLSLVEVLLNGVKVYVMPKILNKGEALRRFKKKMEKYSPEKIIAAGDSLFDIEMLKRADIALMPEKLAQNYSGGECVQTVGIAKSEIFSDYLLNYIIMISGRKV